MGSWVQLMDVRDVSEVVEGLLILGEADVPVGPVDEDEGSQEIAQLMVID